MDTEKELRKWLNRSELSFIENLEFGMKVWNSIEFVLLSKEDIIIDEFCNNLKKLQTDNTKCKEKNYLETAWNKINEFLSFRYSPGAVNVSNKAKLVMSLTEEAEKSIAQSKVMPLILKALLITLRNPSMQSFYKSNVKNFAKFVSVSIQYTANLLQVNDATSDNCKEYKQHIDEIINLLRVYIRQTSSLDSFKSAFATDILQNYSDLVILCGIRGIEIKTDFLSILQELYFNGIQTKHLKQYFANRSDQQGCNNNKSFEEFRQVFDVSLHVFLLVSEALILSYRNDFEMQQIFFQYLLNDTGGRLNVQNSSIKTPLIGLTIFMQLLRKYEISLKFEIDSMKAHVYLGKYIEQIVKTNYSTLPIEVLDLLCATLRLDPLVLEYSICQIAVKFMLMSKNDELIWKRYEEFMFLVIEMFRKLNRAEKFISQLFKNLFEELSTIKLSKKLKRSFNTSLVDGAISSKKLKKSANKSISMDIDDIDLNTLQTSEHQSIILLAAAIHAEYGISCKQNVPIIRPNNQLWNNIAFVLSPAISSTYTRFISGLVTKPSLIVWKSLVFILKDYIKELKEADGKCSENSIFLIEITSALLSEYFIGSRIAEQSDKSWTSIETNWVTTENILADFGHAILNQEHNSRTMNAFLKLCHSASSFYLVWWYYRPDSFQSIGNSESCSNKLNTKAIHTYLTEKEWTTIEQRIMNFGKRECKANINKIYLQRLKAAQLFETLIEFDITNYILTSAFSDIEQITDILNDPLISNWFIENLKLNQKRSVCELLLQKPDEISKSINLQTINNVEFIEILIFTVYKNIFEMLASGKNADYLSKIDFEEIFLHNTTKACKDLSMLLTDKFYGDKSHTKTCHNNIRALLKAIKLLPSSFCKSNLKSVMSLFNIVIYKYLIECDEDELSTIAINNIKALFHFGDAPNIFNELDFKTFITLVKDESIFKSIIAMIFERTKEHSDTYDRILSEFLTYLQQFDEINNSEQRLLLNVAVYVIGDLAKDKSKKEQFDEARDTLFKIIVTMIDNQSTELNNWFLLTTLPAFVTLIKILIRVHKSDNIEFQDGPLLKKLIKLYLNNSIDCTNVHSVQLLNTLFENKVCLQLTNDELKEINNSAWSNFKDVCNKNHDDITKKILNTALKLILDHRTSDEWIELLTELEHETIASIFTEKSNQQMKVLEFMARCQLNSIKGKIFVRFFKNLTRQIKLMIRFKSVDITDNFNQISDMFNCYITLISNVQTPVSLELIDDILLFMTEINIKKIDPESFESHKFFHLLEKMCLLSLELIQHRSTFIIDRVPHFVSVLKDILQTICWYKSKRNQYIQLEQAEVTMLAEMALNMEKTIKNFTKHSKEVKRVAPYLLLFIINLMITNERPTTLYSKVKMHIEYICYDLISICDHRVEGFILRNCNEASKSIYENLHREFEKYFKFKGKV